MTESDFPTGTGAPAVRAFKAAGYHTVEQLAGVPITELRTLHGVGPRSLGVVQAALEERGLSLG